MSHPDDDISRLLHDAVSDVQPHGTFDDIRSRTDKVVPMKRWFFPTLAVAAVMAAVVGGAFWLVNNDNDPTANPPATQPSSIPASPTSPASSPSPDGTSTTMRSVDVFYLGHTVAGPRLFKEKHQFAADVPNSFGLAAVQEAMHVKAHDPDFSSAWPAGITVAFSSTDNPGLVDLNIARGSDLSRPAGMSAEVARLSLEQVVRSFDAGVGSDVKVRFFWAKKVGGGFESTDAQITSVLGVDTSQPLGPGPDADVLAPVQIDSPANGAAVDGTFTVTGRANAFEANVVWELKQGDAIVEHGHATAQECCTLSPYSFPVTAPPGDYTLVVHDEDMSGQDRPVNQDTKEITVK